MTISLTGIGVTRGFAVGAARVFRRENIEVPRYEIRAEEVHAEVARYHDALSEASLELRTVRGQFPESVPREIVAFLDTHLLMLEDALLRDGPVKLIKSHLHNAEWALKLQRDTLVASFDEIGDAYLRSRKDDVEHVVTRVLRALLKQPPESTSLAPDHLRGRIVVADDISPTEALYLHQHHVAGLVTEHGGPTSHTAILARNLGIPALVGVAHARRVVNDDDALVIDAPNGVLLVGADDLMVVHFLGRVRALANDRAALSKLRGAAAVTADRQRVLLLANIEFPEDIAEARKIGAAGVGLYRTEFLFMERSEPPGEDEQYEAYARAVRAFRNAPVIIRTIDVGADKDPYNAVQTAPANNPALGLRGVRYSLREPALFKTQLRAILRASAHGRARIMFPMLSSLHELAQVTRLVEEVKAELAARRVRFDPNTPIGCVIETPAAALVVERLARCVGFLSIGTNDLIQYTLAVDRTDNNVAHLFEPTHPAVLKLIRSIIRAGAWANIPVAMCGEMAGDVRYTRLLLGLGLREFSVHPSVMLEVKRMIKSTRVKQLRGDVRRVLACLTAQDANEILESLNR
jgi:phosphotransferase system enzyme I (PtsI)